MSKFSIASIVQAAAGDVVPEVSGEIVKIPREKIAANDKNFYAMSDLEELASSIALTGLIHPIIVKQSDAGYTVVDGERRFRAMGLLEWAECPAIIRRPTNDVLEELMLIEANRTQRKISDAELAQQADRYTELLAQLKDAGIEIPGRLRDRVAEAMDVSASKLARLHKIQTSLINPLAEKFRAGSLNESVAYELAKRSPERQQLFIRKDLDKLTASTVRDLCEYADDCFSERDCPYGGKCNHGEAMFKTGKDERSYNRCVGYNWSGRDGCCKACPDRMSCKTVCSKAAATVAKEKSKAEAKQAKDDAEREDERQKKKAIADADWSRLRSLREAAGIDIDEVQIGTYWSYKQHESRTDLPPYQETHTVVDAFNAGALMAVADLFGVSCDTILGREIPEAKEAEKDA